MDGAKFCDFILTQVISQLECAYLVGFLLLAALHGLPAGMVVERYDFYPAAFSCVVMTPHLLEALHLYPILLLVAWGAAVKQENGQTTRRTGHHQDASFATSRTRSGAYLEH